jgi:hypothetical protein
MSGGVAYVLDADGTFAARCNMELVGFDEIGEADAIELHELIEEHHLRTLSPVAARDPRGLGGVAAAFVKVMPHDYKRALADMAAAERPMRADAERPTRPDRRRRAAHRNEPPVVASWTSSPNRARRSGALRRRVRAARAAREGPAVDLADDRPRARRLVPRRAVRLLRIRQERGAQLPHRARLQRC